MAPMAVPPPYNRGVTAQQPPAAPLAPFRRGLWEAFNAWSEEGFSSGEELVWEQGCPHFSPRKSPFPHPAAPLPMCTAREYQSVVLGGISSAVQRMARDFAAASGGGGGSGGSGSVDGPGGLNTEGIRADLQQSATCLSHVGRQAMAALVAGGGLGVGRDVRWGGRRWRRMGEQAGDAVREETGGREGKRG